MIFSLGISKFKEKNIYIYCFIIYEHSYNLLNYHNNSLSTLDIMVYGHLATHLYSDLPNPSLAIILRTEFPRLVMFCDRMKDRLSEREIIKFPANDLPSVFTGILRSPRAWFNNTLWQARNLEKEEKSQTQKDFERKRIISITGAILFMATYVIWNKIISIEVISEKDDKEENVYYDNDGNDDNDDDDDDDNDDDDNE